MSVSINNILAVLSCAYTILKCHTVCICLLFALFLKLEFMKILMQLHIGLIHPFLLLCKMPLSQIHIIYLSIYFSILLFKNAARNTLS